MDRPTEVEHDRLQNERTAWLCTVRPDGRPHLTPIWFAFVDDRFWFATGGSTVKARNITADPRVSVSMQDGDDPIVVEGRATLHPTGRPDAVVLAFDRKYGWDITQPDAPQITGVVLIEVEISKWLAVSS